LFRTALTDIAHRGVPGLTGFFTGHGRSLAFAGTALAVAGAGISTTAAASAATAGPATTARTTTPAVTVASHISLSDDLGGRFWAAPDRAETAGPLKPLQTGHATGRPAADPRPAAAHPARQAHQAPVRARARVHVVKRARTTWQQIQEMVARQTFPRSHAGALPWADRVQPGSVSGPQAYLPMTASRMANATTIVRQDLARHMGLRSAVIAVATAMQESTLENISYGDRDSEGLFQQRPSAGWGSPSQITNPAYAAGAFLSALHSHQATDPGWASQPLWENAQAVQNSGFPYAYAKWESQAAQVVAAIARHMF